MKMLKMVMCVKRLPSLTREEFDDYWLNKHAAFVVAHKDALKIRKYVQTIPLPNPAAQAALQSSRGTIPADFDGLGQVWWDDMASHLSARQSEEGLRILSLLLEDEKKFVDHSQSVLWYATERDIIVI
jgi:hypothetical protein